MKFISFYTDDEIYKPLGLALIKQFQTYNLDHYVKELPAAEFTKIGWNNVVIYKPLFIKEMLEKFKCSVVWVDVDTIINEHPQFLFEYEKREIELSYLARPKPFLAIMYSKYNSKMINFFENFAEECKKDLEKSKRHIEKRPRWYEGDQPTLMKIGLADVKFESFPGNAISKFEEHKHTVFVETQASRMVRSKIKSQIS
jgi:chloramphenicol O-acetyltransferase